MMRIFGYLRFRVLGFSPCNAPLHYRGFRKVGEPFWGVPIIRIIVFLGPYWGPPMYGNYNFGIT